MLTTDGLVGCSILEVEAVGKNTGGALLGVRPPLLAGRGRETSRAAGGGFLIPLSIVFRGVVVTMGGSGGGSFVVGYRLPGEGGPLKFGLGNE